MRRAGRLVLLCGCLLSLAGSAAATDVSRQELDRIAASSGTSDASRVAARAITSVDGQPVDMVAILGGASDDEVAGRLTVLSSLLAGASSPDPNASAHAREILASKDYTERDFPKPVRRPIEWAADRFRAMWHWLDLSLPGGAWVVWVVIGGLVAVLVAIGAASAVRRRGVEASARNDRGPSGVPSVPTSRELDAMAETAERDGDLRSALRFRFQAGLLRLGASHAIDSPDTATGDQLAHKLQSRRFDRLRRTFDEVIYGGRAVTSSDLVEARTEWPVVADEARRI